MRRARTLGARATAILLAVALLSACAGTTTSTTTSGSSDTTASAGPTTAPTPDSTAPGDTAPDDRRVELTFMNWFFQDAMQEAYEGHFDSFMAQEERVTGFVPQVHPFVRYVDVLNVRLSSGDYPNMAWIPTSHGDTYLNEELLVDLTPHIEAVPDFDLADFGAGADRWTVDGKVLALPFTNATNVMFFNVSAFEAAGVKTPIELEADGEWTWEKLREIAAELTASGEVRFGFGFGNNIFTNGWRTLIDIYGPYGARPWSEDGRTCLFDAPESVAAVELVHGMIFEDGSHPGPGVDVAFAAGDIGMWLTRHSFAPQYLDAGFEWDVIRAPDGPAGFVPSLSQNGIAAFAGAENSDLAADFVVHSLTTDRSAAFSVNTPSPRLSLQTLEVLTPVTPFLTEEQLERAVLPSLSAENVVFDYSHPNYGPVEANAGIVFDGQIWVPDADVPGALAEACASIVDLLGG